MHSGLNYNPIYNSGQVPISTIYRTIETQFTTQGEFQDEYRVWDPDQCMWIFLNLPSLRSSYNDLLLTTNMISLFYYGATFFIDDVMIYTSLLLFLFLPLASRWCQWVNSSVIIFFYPSSPFFLNICAKPNHTDVVRQLKWKAYRVRIHVLLRTWACKVGWDNDRAGGVGCFVRGFFSLWWEDVTQSGLLKIARWYSLKIW